MTMEEAAMKRLSTGLMGLVLAVTIAVTIAVTPVGAQDKFVMGYGAGT